MVTITGQIFESMWECSKCDWYNYSRPAMWYSGCPECDAEVVDVASFVFHKNDE